MSNFLLRMPEAVLIHIPKTGGTSIRKGVWAGRAEGPAFGRIPAAWRDHFRFAFVRDPLERFLSAWRMFTQGSSSAPRRAHPLSLRRFADIVLDERIAYGAERRTLEERIRHHTIPMTHPFNCLREAQFIGRHDRMDADFARIAAHLGFSARLPRLHVTAAAPVDPEAELGQELSEALRAYYAADYRFLADELPGYRRLG